MDLPYQVEYAKSGRASCRGCKSAIAKESLRLAVMVQSPTFDGRMAQWYHSHCFFGKQRPRTTDDIDKFETLRWEDQEKLRKKIAELGSSVVPSAKGKKRGASGSAASKSALQDFCIEYAKSSRAECRGCQQKIMKDEVRISKKDYETDVGKRYGGQAMWHHVACFAKLRSELGYFESIEKLPGFKTLSSKDQIDLKPQLPAIKQEEAAPEIKKVKKDDDDQTSKLEKEIKEQTITLYKHRDNLKKHLKKEELLTILEANEQIPPPGIDRILDLVADLMTFGRLLPCPECEGQLRFEKGGYQCHGNVTEWTKCEKMFKEPKRDKCIIPEDLRAEYSFLAKYKSKVMVRKLKEVAPTAAVKKDEVDAGPKVQRDKPPLYHMEFVILGKLDEEKDKIKKTISKLGGKVTSTISDKVMAIISNQAEVDKLGSRMTTAKESGIHVVPLEFLEKAKDNKSSIPELIHKMSLCDWGTDANKRLPKEPEASLKSKSRSIYTSKVPSKVSLKLKGGMAVDPDSGLEDKAHVYQSGEDKYTAVLGVTDIQKQKNSYYKLQLLQSDKGGQYWVFRAWGRIGTTIGGNKLEKMDSLHEAKSHFKHMYEEKSGNCWDMRAHFMKVPGLMYPIDIDYGEDEANFEITNDVVPSKLHAHVQKLVHMIFDLNSMKKVMLEFELDTEKMPLGKLSKNQMKKAFSVLSEAQALIDTKDVSQSLIIDVSNRFYTFLPHSVGVGQLPLLDNTDIIKQKIDMINNLMELEIAYNLMKGAGNGSVDTHYEKLNTAIDVVEETSEEYRIIKEYVRNTHAPTHTNYELDIEAIFAVKRQGEERRFKPFRKLHNRKLLWHGSRVTNFAGILSQGLRIAPPEAPVTGYMFGKGIYFADMVSKSANYCCTNMGNDTGLLLLCDVALGDMYERHKAEYIEKLPKGKHSCKGVGRTHPDPSLVATLHDNIEVPIGKPVDSTAKKTDLLYNEYIVYDVAQVNVKYLLQMKFKYQF